MIVSLLLPALLLGQTSQQNLASLHDTLQFLKPIRDMVQVNDVPYVLLPPQFVDEGDVGTVEWSSDGSMMAYVKATNSPTFDENLLVQNLDELKKQTLCEWSFFDPHPKDFVTIDAGSEDLGQIEWLHGSDTLLVLMAKRVPGRPREPETLYRFRPNGNGKEIFADQEKNFFIDCSSTQNLAIIDYTGSSHEPYRMILLEDDGTKLVPVEPLAIGQIPLMDRKGLPCVGTRVTSEDPNVRGFWMAQMVDLETGVFKMSPTAKWEPMQFDEGRIEPTSANIPAPAGRSVGVPTWWIKGTDKKKPISALISTDTQHAWLSPKMNAVAYVSQGCLFVRRLVKLNPALAKALDDLAQQEQAMSNAKQVALAMMMYANDWDDNLPGVQGWSSSIEPYVKNPDLLSGFVYSYTGTTDTTKIANPATTVLGYIQTSNGRAVAYTDGHVQWLPNP